MEKIIVTLPHEAYDYQILGTDQILVSYWVSKNFQPFWFYKEVPGVVHKDQIVVEISQLQD